MKKIIYILALLSVSFFSACEVENGESGYYKTLQGKIAYDAVEGRLSQWVSLLDLMTKVDYYGQASVAEKEGIKNYFLPSYTVTNTDNTWVLKDDYQEIVFTHNQKSIHTDGAIWTVKVSTKLWDGQTAIIVEDKDFQVETLGDKDWKVIAKNLKLYSPASGYSYPSDNLSDSESLIKGSKAYEKSPNLFDFKVESGNGSLNLSSTKMSYSISEPVAYTYISSFYSNLAPVSGKLDITADKDKISAKIIATNYAPRIEITFNGLTESYN